MEKEDIQLKQVLQEGHQNDSPSMSFTANVMRKIEVKRTARLKPIIGKLVWLLIGIFFLTVITIPFLTNNSTQQFDPSDLSIPTNLGLILMIIFMSGIFILFDEFYLRKRRARQ